MWFKEPLVNRLVGYRELAGRPEGDENGFGMEDGGWFVEDGLSNKDWSVPPQVMVMPEILVDDLLWLREPLRMRLGAPM